MPKGYPLEERKEIPMKLLADYPLVLYRDDFNLHDDILSNCKKIGFTPKIVLRRASAISCSRPFPRDWEWRSCRAAFVRQTVQMEI